MKSTPQDTDSPRISTILIFLNGEAFLADAIESVIAQSVNSWELLLVDDGSGPAATSIAKSYAEKVPGRIRYLEHSEHINRGMSASRNLGIQHARGEFVAFIDADDIWLSDHLAGHMAVLEEHTDVGMVCGAAIYWRSWANGEDNLVPTGKRQDVVIRPPEAILGLYPLGAAQPPSPSDILARADLVRKLGGFEEQFTGLYEDQAFLCKMHLSTSVYFRSAASFKYRQHAASCMAMTKDAGTYHQFRFYFLEWLEAYLKRQNKVDPRVTSSLHRALRYYRNPRIHELFVLTARARQNLKRVIFRYLSRFMEIERPLR